MSRNVIGEGTYGCVHKPSLPCNMLPKPGFTYDNYVSKLMATQNARDELKEFIVIGSIDKKDEYHLGQPILCTPKLNEEIISDINKCSKIKTRDIISKPHNYSLLVIKYGGPDLYVFCNNNLNTYLRTKKQEKSDIFWLGVHNLFKGLRFFRDNNIVHYDLKPQNILFNMETGKFMFIDFGLMKTKNTVRTTSRNNTNYLGTFHWSYPFDCGFMNKPMFDLYKNATNETRVDIYNSFSNMLVNNELTNKYNLPIKRPAAFDILFTYINPELVQPTSVVKYSYVNNFFDDLYLKIDRFSYDEYLDHTINSIDIYGLGFTLQFCLNHFYKKKAISLDFYRLCSSLFMKMYDFTPFTRELNIDILLSEYENILLESGLLARMNKDFIDHNLEDKRPVPTKIIEEYKEELRSPPKPLSAELERIAEMDPVRIITTRSCPEGKELNPNTNRCVNKCNPGYNRNEEFKCRKTRKQQTRPKSKSKSISIRPKSKSIRLTSVFELEFDPCERLGKQLNPKTGNCVAKCKPGYRRNQDFKCVRTEERKRKITSKSIIKTCPNTKELNPKTNRCINRCKSGYRRNEEFKCVRE